MIRKKKGVYIMQNVVAVIFKTESEGFQAMSELRQKPLTDQTAIMQMMLVKRENNTFTVCDSFDSGVNTADDTLVGGIVGGLVGILGGPIGVLLLGSYGALVGSAFDTEDMIAESAMIEKVAQKMIEGEVALIILADEDEESSLDARLQKFGVEVARFDAAVIAEEVDEAYRVEKEMNRLARKELRDSKKAEFQGKVEARRAKMKEDFAKVKEVLNTEL